MCCVIFPIHSSMGECNTILSAYTKYPAEPHSSVGSVQDLESFRGLMIVIETGFIPLSSLSIISTTVIWDRSQCLEKIKELWESMDRRTGRRDITLILFKRRETPCNQYHTIQTLRRGHLTPFPTMVSTLWKSLNLSSANAFKLD